MTVNVATLTVGTAWRWGAGLNNRILHDGFHTAVDERVTFITPDAGAHRYVVHHLAHSIVTADSWTGIHTTVSHTGLVPWTVR